MRFTLAKRLDWRRDGDRWPNRGCSRFVTAGGIRWHVQLLGQGPVLLLLHGTGAATHSWRDLAPLLAEHFTIIAPDLPGHGFTEALPYAQMSLPGMSAALGALLERLGLAPEAVVGHSAGAAIMVRACLDARLAPRALIAINGALLPWRGVPGQVFSPTARLFAAVPVISRFLSWHALDRKAVEGLMANTGSQLDDTGIELYRRLIGDAGHVRATLSMMANWDLEPLAQALPALEPPLLLIVGEADGTVSPREAERVRARLPGTEIQRLPGLGHLAHEECPEIVAGLIRERLAPPGLSSAPS
ncbi:alpha/beta fold hydrolase BchO [Marichromatium bheemlicum]|uniref:Alpha/beta fold hydrolase n=1 Tax=Marichromatium bheemlicum TaxID=365339 RepID=A0ABX1I6F8_9GAMM|nr:alpha/beta fold hydrolase BchO [Marichromatium bheemlicum]NKN33062.1 alpha/beta fold hydrolase [Marichromatium bheemlicum]